VHLRRDAAEAFYVLEGTYEMYFDGREEVFTSAAMVGFFEQLSQAEVKGEATVELLGRIAERHEMEITGPVPDSYL
jgi:uncharacterized cupin superfamily protein